MKKSLIVLLVIVTNLTAQIKLPDQAGYLKAEMIYSLDNKPTPQCHASTIVSTKSGLAAAWFGGTKEKAPDVGIWFSRNVNNEWTEPIEVANGIDGDKQYPCWNPVLFLNQENELMLFYKVGPNPVEWWGMVMSSKDDGVTWSKPEWLPENILGPIKNKPVQLGNGKIISPSSTENDGWKVHLEVSIDNGKSWKLVDQIPNPKNYSVIQPAILYYGKDTLQLLCRSKDGFIIQSWSYDNGESWNELSLTELPNPNSGIDAVTLKDGRQLLVYNHTGRIEGKWSGLRTPLNVAISEDGINWKSDLILENESGEYSYPAVIQTPDGFVHITYTYRRETIKHVIVDPAKLKFTYK
jgi:predicted neuraminidase